MAHVPSTPTLIPPLPGSTEDSKRREHTRKRLRMLRGEWFGDLQRHTAQHFDPVRERIVGKPDISTNVFRSVVDQLAVLYDRPPVLHHEDNPAAAETAAMLLADAGWWSLASRLQRFVLGLRECFVRPTLTPRGLLIRLVTPDCVHAEASPEEPDLPVKLTEARLRNVEGEDGWYWDQFDLSDPADPVYRVVRARDDEDVTALVLGRDVSGASYPFRLSDGSPVLPYATYHAVRSGELWNWMDGIEAVEGTLTIAVLWSWWIHAVRDTAWAQRWSLDAQLRGAAASGSGLATASAVTTDPSSVMQFRSDGDRASLGQWNPPVDPLTLGTAIAEFEQRLLVHFGLSPADVQRSEQAQSGYALSLRRDAVRQAQRRYVAQFQRGDLQLLRIVSALTQGGIPEDGWSLTYPGQPESVEEIHASLERHQMLIEAGLESKVDAYMDLHPGVSREQATEALKRIAEETRALG